MFLIIVLGDLVVQIPMSVLVGSRGLNSVQEMVLGSVSHKIAKRVQCPVLIVK